MEPEAVLDTDEFIDFLDHHPYPDRDFLWSYHRIEDVGEHEYQSGEFRSRGTMTTSTVRNYLENISEIADVRIELVEEAGVQQGRIPAAFLSISFGEDGISRPRYEEAVENPYAPQVYELAVEGPVENLSLWEDRTDFMEDMLEEF
jgi:hypothetical protein